MEALEETNPLVPQRQTLAESAVRVLRTQLDSGRWTECLPGERVLCDELQISRPTLRHALQVLEREGRLQVAQGRQRRITGHAGDGIPADRRKVIGLLCPLPLEALPPFALFWIDEVRTHLAKHGYQLEFHACAACAAQHPERALEVLVHGAPSAVWILLPATPQVQKWFMNRQLACLVTGSCAPGIALPSVDIDYRAACRHAAGVFHARGHQHLALVIPAAGLAGDADSELGFKEGAANGPAPVIIRHDGRRHEVMRKIDATLRLPEPPSAFLVARASHALTVQTLLMRRGKQLPQDAAVISRDDDVFLDYATPLMARYTTNKVAFARRLSRTILQIVRSGRIPPRPIRLIPQFNPNKTV
jgi:LacI family transcriptional regulator